MVIPDFWLVISADFEWSETVTTEHEVWKLAWQPDAVAIYRCCPSDSIIRDVTEDCAHAWFEANWGVDDPIPALFLEFVEDEAAQRENAQDEVGSW